MKAITLIAAVLATATLSATALAQPASPTPAATVDTQQGATAVTLDGSRTRPGCWFVCR